MHYKTHPSKACISSLQKDGIFQDSCAADYNVSLTWRELAARNTTIFIAIRNPYDRAVSSYYYTLSQPKAVKAKVLLKTKEYDFSHFLLNLFILDPYISAGHFGSQVEGLMIPNYCGSRINFLQTENLVNDMNQVIFMINNNLKSKSYATNNTIVHHLPHFKSSIHSNTNNHLSFSQHKCHPENCALLLEKSYYLKLDVDLLGYPRLSESDAYRNTSAGYSSLTNKSSASG
jgi:hypothetical protein